jgi:hypothetical protein|tara:strand:+ start:372 stop:590 length:219 start_codon:yes stop_codon:yes gene_type:complete
MNQEPLLEIIVSVRSKELTGNAKTNTVRAKRKKTGLEISYFFLAEIFGTELPDLFGKAQQNPDEYPGWVRTS